MSVSTLLDGIEKGRIVLPAIQRDFVWNEDRIEKLFDSLFRGYPIGVVLLWDTTEAIQYRTFVADHRSGAATAYKVNDGETVQLVLDGQQRLTSLYIALRGSLNGRKLHFDVLSGRSSDDASEEKFSFKFMTPEEAMVRNAEAVADNGKDTLPSHHVALVDFSGPSAPKSKLARQLKKDFGLSDDDEDRVRDNLHRPVSIMTETGGLLQEQIIDAGLPQGSADRKTVFDILEIFMRINTQGINLTTLTVIFHTNKHRQDRRQWSVARSTKLTPMSSDTFDLVEAARRCAKAGWPRDGKPYEFTKAGAMLDDLLPIEDRPRTLFDVVRPKSAQLMDAVNDRFGKKTMVLGSEGMKRTWALRANHRSQRYTTRIEDLPVVR